MQQSKLFPNRQSQTVRLPKACRFNGDEVIVKRVGDAVLLLRLAYDTDVLLRELAQPPEETDLMEAAQSRRRTVCRSALAAMLPRGASKRRAPIPFHLRPGAAFRHAISIATLRTTD